MVLAEITKKDLEDLVLHKKANEIWEQELIKTLDNNTLFNSAVYAMLSARKNVPKLNYMVQELKKYEITTPESAIEKIHIVKAIVPSDKAEFMQKLSEWWKQSNIAERIIQDYTGPKVKAIEIRNEFRKSAKGLGHKCASLFLRTVGYENIAPMDVWAIRYLRDRGYRVMNPDLDDRSGAAKRRAPKPMPWQGKLDLGIKNHPIRYHHQVAPNDGQYDIYEHWFAEEGRMHGFTVAKFQCFLWAKYSTWPEKKNPNQLDLFLQNALD